VEGDNLAVLLALQLLFAVGVQLVELLDIARRILVVVGLVLGIGLLQLVADDLD
jgi:hypothetical protein